MVTDLAPLLRVMGEYKGATMLNDPTKSDISYLNARIAEIKTSAKNKV